SPRGLTTTHRPTPQPSLANRPRPLMQTFRAASPALHTASPHTTTASHIDATVLPSTAFLSAPASSPSSHPRVPLLPDNYGAAHSPLATDANPLPEVTIVAANPENVVPGAPNAGIEGIGLDGIELKFLYDEPAALPRGEQARGGMIRDIWKGMVEKTFGGTAKKAVE
ncbi:hypothetical protein E4U41_003110, partial [Claviceps citrina]